MAALNQSYHQSAVVHATASSSRNLSLSSNPSSRLFNNQTLKLNKSFSCLQAQYNHSGSTRRVVASASAIVTGSVQEVLPPALDSTSEPPAIFDGNTRLYISYTCPFAQRAWIARNCKGLQGKIQLVPIDLKNRPAWYKEKVYPPNKVPSLEHINEVKGESLDLIKYIDNNFEGSSLFTDDSFKKVFAEDLLNYTTSFSKSVTTSFKTNEMNEAAAAFDYIETALAKFDDGPFFLGHFSLEMNKIEAYRQTRRDPKELIESYKKRFLAQP